MTRKEAEEEKKTENMEEDEIFNLFEGLEEEGASYYISRIKDNGEKEFLTTEQEYSLGLLQKEFGGGRYIVEARSGGAFVSRKKFVVGGKSRYRDGAGEGENKNLPILFQNENGIGQIKDIIKAVGELKGETKQEDPLQSIKVMSAMSEAMNSMLAMNMEANRKVMELVNGAERKETGEGIVGLLSVIAEKVGDLITNMQIAKNPHLARTFAGGQGEAEEENPKLIEYEKKIEEVNSMQIKQIVYKLNKGQEKNTDHSELVDELNEFYPELAGQLKNTGYKKAIGQLRLVGLKVTNEEWLKGLYKLLTGASA